MGLTDAPAVTRLSPGDITQAMELSREAGWNQLPADWRLFVGHGEVLGIVEEGRLEATAAIMPYGTDLAWIGMVLTRQNRRGRGFGTALLKACIAAIEAEGRTALLDATPAGEPIYRGLGFEPVARFSRWQGEGKGGSAPTSAHDTPAAIAAANAAFGADRTPLLEDFAARCPAARMSAGDGSAHAFGRDGRLATQIGSVTGTGEEAATALVETVIGALDGPVFLDVADDCTMLAAKLGALGFVKQRPFLRMRMRKGPAPVPGAAGGLFVIAGPEFG